MPTSREVANGREERGLQPPWEAESKKCKIVGKMNTLN
jgi:hypothetical protein